MELDHEICYRAMAARDPRFDGHFFTAVLTTKIYCRPICPAPKPKPENCIFFPCAAAAQEAGFRPCLRCRPELSPDISAALGPTGVVARALRYILEGALDEGSVGELAAQLGVTERHLRRLCMTHLGASPVVIAQTRRILFAKQLIDETDLPFAEVGLAAGFNSVRRFIAVMQQVYQRSPRELRRDRADVNHLGMTSPITLRLPFAPPYNWEAMNSFLKRRAIPGVEVVTPELYQRTISLGGSQGVVEVRPVNDQNYLVATVWFPQITLIAQVIQRIRSIFDLGTNTNEISQHLQDDPYLGPIVAALPGLRVPGTWDPFELSVRAILGQQISVRGASTLAGRVAEAYGEPLAIENVAEIAPELRRIFPDPEVLAHADLLKLGIPRARAVALTTLATTVANNPRLLYDYHDLDDLVRRLCRLPGIGMWTAHYIAMRALHEPDAFPSTDLGLLRATSHVIQPLNAEGLAKIAEAWRPWRAYAAMYLWHASYPLYSCR